jgi:hypothetical protein
MGRRRERERRERERRGARRTHSVVFHDVFGR